MTKEQQKTFEIEATSILTAILYSFPSLIDFNSDEEINGADLVETMSHYLLLNLSPESRFFLKKAIKA